jgi:hypothetical protein
MSRTLSVKREFYVAITCGQAVCVMVAPEHHHRRNLIRIARHSNVEMAPAALISVRLAVGQQ